MDRNTFLFAWCIIAFQSSFCQTNLIPNPSFEDTNYCPPGAGWFTAVQNWYNPNFSSPDYFHTCNTPGSAGVPNNNWGYQYAKDGLAYVAIATYSSPSSLVREYVGCKLIDTLKSGRYCVKFYVSLANRSSHASNGISVYFSSDTVMQATGDTVSLVPNYINTNIITDTSNWIEVSFMYNATGIETDFIIGNFRSNYITDTSGNGGSAQGAYYYIDDVSVTLCSDDSSSVIIPNVFTPNNDGMNDIFQLNTISLESVSCRIYNRWGTIVYEIRGTGDFWDGRTTSGQECEEGVYYYVLIAKGEDGVEYEQTGFLHLMR